MARDDGPKLKHFASLWRPSPSRPDPPLKLYLSSRQLPFTMAILPRSAAKLIPLVLLGVVRPSARANSSLR